jgi:hypothetical protein
MGFPESGINVDNLGILFDKPTKKTGHPLRDGRFSQA